MDDQRQITEENREKLDDFEARVAQIHAEVERTTERTGDEGTRWLDSLDERLEAARSAFAALESADDVTWRTTRTTLERRFQELEEALEQAAKRFATT